MTGLRLLGLFAAVLILSYAILNYRGARWNRQNFYLLLAFGLGLFVVSVNPDSVNILRDVFNLGNFEYGRLFSLVLLAAVAANFFALYTKMKLDTLKHQVDRVFCAIAGDTVDAETAPDRMKKIMIIMPALNEAESLRNLLPRIPKQIDGHDIGVLVIDDGSSDETSKVTIENGYSVARNPINRGQGAASRVGYLVLRKHGAEIGVTMDSDGQHRPEDLAIMIRPILENKYDLVIGSRILGTQDSDSQTRFMGIYVLSWVVSLVTGVKITDCSSGLKAFRMSEMSKVMLKEDQFQASEVIIDAAKKGLRIGEVPIHIAAREFGESRKGRNMSYGFYFFKTLVKSWLR